MGTYIVKNISDITVERQLEDGTWIPATPISFYPNIFVRLWRKLKYALKRNN